MFKWLKREVNLSEEDLDIILGQVQLRVQDFLKIYKPGIKTLRDNYLVSEIEQRVITNILRRLGEKHE